ncbi:hypothetical protein ACN47E_001722 [Coniothyrium glycines]
MQANRTHQTPDEPSASGGSVSDPITSDGSRARIFHIPPPIETPTLENTTTSTATTSVSNETPKEDSVPFDTEFFPQYGYLLPSSRNGTPTTTALHALAHPISTASSLYHDPPNLDPTILSTKLEDLVALASDHINRAAEGHDVVEMGNRVADLVPRVSVPNFTRLLDTVVDSTLDAVQNMLPERQRHDDGATVVDGDVQGRQWAFARYMGSSARRSLVAQEVLREWQVGTEKPWVVKLNYQLARFFEEHVQEFGGETLFEMKPVWRVTEENKAWELVLEGDVVDLGLGEGAEALGVGFQLPGEAGAGEVKGDKGKGKQQLEEEEDEEWEQVD